MNANAELGSFEATQPMDHDVGAHRIAAMFDEHYDSIWRTLRRLGVKDANADDAAQRVFVIASSKIADIHPSQEGGYLYGVALKVASEMRRRDPALREVVDPRVLDAIADEASGPEDLLLQNEARDALDEALEGMPEDLRAVLVLVEIEGLAIAELAAVLDVPLGTATSRLRRAREAFSMSARRVRARLGHGTAERNDGGAR